MTPDTLALAIACTAIYALTLSAFLLERKFRREAERALDYWMREAARRGELLELHRRHATDAEEVLTARARRRGSCRG